MLVINNTLYDRRCSDCNERDYLCFYCRGIIPSNWRIMLLYLEKGIFNFPISKIWQKRIQWFRTCSFSKGLLSEIFDYYPYDFLKEFEENLINELNNINYYTPEDYLFNLKSQLLEDFQNKNIEKTRIKFLTL